MTTVNADQPSRWKTDIAESVDFYNEWFIRFAPKAYRETRISTTEKVESALKWTNNLTNVSPSVLCRTPSVLPILRMTTAPPLARDRLIGLAGVTRGLLQSMEVGKRVPPRMGQAVLESELQKLGRVIMQLADSEICPWLLSKRRPSRKERYRAASIIADRLCGAEADPIIRNAQERRQLASIKRWLERKRYAYVQPRDVSKFDEMRPGTFSFRLGVPVKQSHHGRHVNIPVDCAIAPRVPKTNGAPLLVEAKSAGDFTNPNKRRKEEATKISQLRSTYGKTIRYVLFLCGYFDSGYLGYEAAEGIDWIWEHRIDDLAQMGV
ncbi:MAG: XamI family restriction endonuclease [Candidatus Omnitrophica bacterium]|nr:XamI family restriction endonuclease [Candidatus Omnitrophota bacterium]